MENFRDDPDITLGAMTTLPSACQLLALCAKLIFAEPWLTALSLVVGAVLLFRMCLPLLQRRRSQKKPEICTRIAAAEISGPNGIAGVVVLCEPRASTHRAGTFITVYLRGVTAADWEFDFGLCSSNCAAGAVFKTPLEASYAPAKSADETWLVMLRGFNPNMSLSCVGCSSRAGIRWTRRGKCFHVTGALEIRA